MGKMRTFEVYFSEGADNVVLDFGQIQWSHRKYGKIIKYAEIVQLTGYESKLQV